MVRFSWVEVVVGGNGGISLEGIVFLLFPFFLIGDPGSYSGLLYSVANQLWSGCWSFYLCHVGFLIPTRFYAGAHRFPASLLTSSRAMAAGMIKSQRL